MKTQTVLAIGAHIGDAELTAGALLASCAVHGGKAVTLALTAGEKGAPAGADIAEYRRGKIAEAEAFAKELGGEAYVLDYEDGLLPDNDEVRFAVCDIIRKVKPDIIVTHHENSMHKDHIVCHRIVVDAWFYAAIEGFQRELPKHFAKKLYFAENWEDAPNGFDQALYDYVYRMGGSLLTVGGQNDVGADGKPTPHAYNRSDLSGTLFQQMLPVQAIDYTPPIAVMLVIDCSGSMSSGRFEAALRGAEECLDSLTERDYCGVMGFSTSSTEHVSVMPVSQKETIRTAIRNLNDEGGGSGGTIFSDAIDQAGRALAAVSVERRHIILVTDGNPSDHLDQSGADDNNYYGRYVDYNYEQSNITMSVITVGMSSGNREQMQKTAERGHGHYYDVSLEDSEGTISINMRQDLAAAAVAELQGGISFVPKIKDQTAVFEGLDSSAVIPALKGYYGTKVKDGARVPLIHDYVPIYAEWDLGAGRVGSFLCDLGGEWSAEFMADAVGRTIVRNISYDLAPDTDLEPDAMDYVLRTDRDNYTTRLDVYTATAEGEKVSVTVMPVSESAKNAYNGNIPVTALGNGISFTFEIKHEGLYRVSIAKTDAAGQTLSSVSFCQSFSYSEEYNAFREEGEGAALLAEVAADGGGRVLSDPVEVFSYFVRFLPRETDPRMVFLIIAMVCLLLDVAVRKFKFKWIHEIVRDRRAMKTLGGGGHGAE